MTGANVAKGCWDFNMFSPNGVFRTNPLKVIHFLSGASQKAAEDRVLFLSFFPVEPRGRKPSTGMGATGPWAGFPGKKKTESGKRRSFGRGGPGFTEK